MRDLSGAKVFSSFDFLNGYSQMSLHPDSRDITTFSVQIPGAGVKYYRYKSVCLGIQNARSGEIPDMGGTGDTGPLWSPRVRSCVY